MNHKSIALAILTILMIGPSLVLGDGNIRVSVIRGNLTMTGARDATGQAFRMIPTGIRNQYELEGLADTTLNSSDTLIVSGVTGDVDIKLYSNESVIILSNGAHEDLLINGRLKIASTSRLSTTVILDSVFCYQTLSISTGLGQDVVVNGNSTFKWKASIQMGAGSDIYYSVNCGTTEMDVDGGSGNDSILVDENLFSRKTILKGQSGDDYLGVVLGSPAEVVELDGGAGNDQFSFDGSDLLLSIRRMESEFPGTFDNLVSFTVTGSDLFATSLLLWSLL